ncbi:hypothetical protein ACFO4L_11630 [Bacillus daqingensis]|uniref:Uncharacterized protein n=1 Tax=Bacillus daqingensis TaxID=872396 RepID=A0ABV9NWJ6_9BACI
MANKLLFSALTATAAAAVYYLRNNENREKAADYVKRAVAEVKGQTKEDEDRELREKVGHSDPLDIQDNSMVDEGAQFSVNYYNEKLKEEEEEDPK